MDFLIGGDASVEVAIVLGAKSSHGVRPADDLAGALEMNVLFSQNRAEGVALTSGQISRGVDFLGEGQIIGERKIGAGNDDGSPGGISFGGRDEE